MHQVIQVKAKGTGHTVSAVALAKVEGTGHREHRLLIPAVTEDQTVIFHVNFNSAFPRNFAGDNLL
jgi:pyridoxine/pyridoxamine 5'-phosphate oxidase